MDKKELKRWYKETERPMGVYRVKNLANGKVFLEAARDINGRLNSCRFQLRMGSHMNKALQREFSEYGEKQFSFTVLDLLEPSTATDLDIQADLAALKDMWLDKLQPYGDRGYHPVPAS